jgi:hypothetical protein
MLKIDLICEKRVDFLLKQEQFRLIGQGLLMLVSWNLLLDARLEDFIEGEFHWSVILRLLGLKIKEMLLLAMGSQFLVHFIQISFLAIRPFLLFFTKFIVER